MSNLLQIFIPVIIVLIGQGAFAFDLNESNRWSHVGLSAGLALPLYGVCRGADISPATSALIAVTTVLIIGHLKEAGDPMYDNGDMLANALGASGGVAIGFSIDLLSLSFSNPRSRYENY